jgi:hypothetical protein
MSHNCNNQLWHMLQKRGFVGGTAKLGTQMSGKQNQSGIAWRKNRQVFGNSRQKDEKWAKTNVLHTDAAALSPADWNSRKEETRVHFVASFDLGQQQSTVDKCIKSRRSDGASIR